MTLTVENVILIGSILLIISILAKRVSTRLSVPSLIIFLIVGMLAGSDGILQIEFQNYKVAQFIGVIALNFILFNGGFSTNWKSVKPILWQGVILSTLGVFLTAIGL
ncbi:MAG TPA: cation:proton antiporter, partial [Flavobacteriaceae bacterium]|nr:cation:proton antiporter [Flavobacteriaceae bacterium]